MFFQLVRLGFLECLSYIFIMQLLVILLYPLRMLSDTKLSPKVPNMAEQKKRK